MISDKTRHIAAMAMLFVGLPADAALAHNPWGTEAVYTYSFSYSLVAAVIISLIILVIAAVLQFSAGKSLSFVEAAALCCAAIGGGSVALGLAAMMLFFLSQAFYLNYIMYFLCALVQAFGSVLGASALYFTAIQGRKLCFVETAAILLAALGGFRLLTKIISMVVSHPPESGGIQIALLIGCFIPGALAAGSAAIQGRRKTRGTAHDEAADAD